MQQVLARTRSLLRPLTLTCALALSGAPAPAVAAVTLDPGESLLFNVDATAYTYDSVELFADLSDLAAGDGVLIRMFGGLNQAGGEVANGGRFFFDSTSFDDFPLFGTGNSALIDGIFSFSIGSVVGFPGSSVTFDDIKIVLSFGFGATPVAVLSFPTGTVPEPSTLALLSLGLLGAGLACRRQQ